MNEALRYRELMVSGSIDRAILHLGAPAAMAALLQAGFLVVDTFWLGRVGPVALAAASTAGFTMWLAQTLGDGAAADSGSVLARAIGAENHAGAERAAAAGRTLGVWGSAIVSAGGLLTSYATFAFMGTLGLLISSSDWRRPGDSVRPISCRSRFNRLWMRESVPPSSSYFR